MAAAAKVTVLWDGHRVQLSGLGQNVAAHQILKRAAEEFGLKGDPLHAHYQLRHQRRVLDLSMTLAQSGVPPNALVDVVRHSDGGAARRAAAGGGADVKIALGLSPGGKRLVRSVAAGLTLREVLEAFSGSAPQDLPLAALDDPGCSLLYVREKYEGPAALAGVTLASIGLTKGSARLTFHYGAGGAAAPAAKRAAAKPDHNQSA